MNKYLRRGLLEIILAIILILIGYYLMQLQNNWYKPMMILGVLSFGIGFLRIIYRLIRKIDRNALLEIRKSKKEN
ncbi:signal peptidase [Sphingobacterium faecium]|uniref:signal peptidase n=1 Tax=Sphingobacterium faecium TaxID=34087 RepID=UPI0024682821|nr:signal peptidase [Sphingobacterium faecium]MDH5828442.1 signal peptidase [Sphingobacterium faecium]